MLRTTIWTTALMLSTAASAQNAHVSGSMPTETGQATFAAIAEIVSVLNEDAATDWAKVNIDNLRAHLLDMDRVTTGADVRTILGENVVEFAVTGSGATVGSIERMTTAHSSMLVPATGWDVQLAPLENGATMRIEVADPDDVLKVRGLGFFGVMTIGAHHQRHHLQIARGGNPHH